MKQIQDDNTMFKGYRWIIDNPEDAIQKYHKSGSFYELQDLTFISEYISDGDVVLDIGANVGNHAIYFSKNTNASKIIVIEPIDKAYKILLANVALNYAHNIDLNYIGFALGHVDTIGYPYMATGKDNLGGTKLSSDPIQEEYAITFSPVKVFRGDNFFSNEKIDFIKIDVETMEMYVLEGLQETISKNRPKMYIEVMKEHFDEFNSWMEKNSYHCVKSIPLADPNDPEVLYSNHLVVPNI